MFRKQHFIFGLALLLLTTAFGANALTVVPPCKDQIIHILARVDTLPAHEEIRTTVTETQEEEKSPLTVVSSKKSIVLRIPPDRFSIIMWKNDELRAESISIGSRTWNREPGAEWTLEKPAKPGSLDEYIEDLAARMERAGKALTMAIDTPVCLGHVELGGRKTLSYTYRYYLSDAQLWVDAETGLPIEERVVSGARALRERSTLTRRFRYDPSLAINAPM